MLVAIATSAIAHAEESPRWVQRPIVLGPSSARFDAGAASAHSAVGTSFEAAIGLPVLLELGVRIGDRPSTDARAASSDAYARLFDHETSNAGGAAISNPEIRARFSALDFGDVALAIEGRLVVPRAADTRWTISPGVPVRMRLSQVRIDTGVFLPVRFTPDDKYTLDVPLTLWLQARDFIFGPITGVRATKDRFDVAAGLGAGVTLFGALDLKAQAYSFRVNDADWKHSFGVGLGLGVTTP